MVPPWVSVMAFLVAGFLAVRLWSEGEYPEIQPAKLNGKTNSLLRIKYGLVHDPSDDSVKHWHAQFLTLRSKGLEPEAAGYEAARNEFVDFEHVNYASQADTIDAVLEAIRRQQH